MDDIVIKGGQVIDGTGAPARVADVAIRAGRIVAIEADRADSADRVIDAHGLGEMALRDAGRLGKARLGQVGKTCSRTSATVGIRSRSRMSVGTMFRGF